MKEIACEICSSAPCLPWTSGIEYKTTGCYSWGEFDCLIRISLRDPYIISRNSEHLIVHTRDSYNHSWDCLWLLLKCPSCCDHAKPWNLFPLYNWSLFRPVPFYVGHGSLDGILIIKTWKLKVKLSRYHHAGAKRERKCRSYSFFTSALDGGQRHTTAALYPRKKDPQYPLYRGLGGPQSCYGHRGQRTNPLPVPGIEHRSSSL